ncbi:hypothetical protein [Arenibaculum pallidiluteum]|uniref:hypothetical protein n=1 Tax=Arenibaculum pallidiluteum TaxID=2812559 RepID=UPI001A96A477|nr:hypothetical protein [Arenibaculum pallidiluteum]
MANREEKTASTGGHEVIVALITLVQKSLWPLVALTAFLTLQQPIYRLFDALPGLANQATTIDYGGFKLTLSEKRSPKPSEEVRSAINNLQPSLLKYYLLFASRPTSACVTLEDRSQRPIEQIDEVNKLIELGILEKRHPEQFQEPCFLSAPTRLGDEVRDFLVNTILSQIESS